MLHLARYRAPGPFLDPGGISPRIFRALSPLRTEAALVAALLVASCAAAGGGARPEQAEVEALRTEVAALRAENRQLSSEVERLTAKVDEVQARLAYATVAPPPAAVAPGAAPLVPEGLAVVRVAPARPDATVRRAPPVATVVPITEPDAGTLSALARSGGRDLSAEAAAELRAARARKDGVARAHALEAFTARYPHHPLADDALLEAAEAYAGAGRADAGCTLARRIADEYPAGDVAPDALWRLAGCASLAGTPEAERRLLTRLVTEFPTSAAARRAGERLAVITGRAAVASPAADPARSGP